MEHLQLPWYLWAFIAITILVSIFDLPKQVIDGASEIGKVILTFAMIAIGLRVSFAALLQSGKRGLVFGLLLFIIQLFLVFIGFLLFKN